MFVFPPSSIISIHLGNNQYLASIDYLRYKNIIPWWIKNLQWQNEYKEEEFNKVKKDTRRTD